MSTLSERVRVERLARGWSQAELARRVTNAGFRMTQGGIALMERRGDSHPRCILQLADALGVSPTWLQRGGVDKMPKASSDRASELPVLEMRSLAAMPSGSHVHASSSAHAGAAAGMP
jgi:transcriptional regulator with XRE-family HTH domain